MSFGKMTDFADIVKITRTKDAEGFVNETETIVATIRVYHEGRHGSIRWANLSVFSEATDLFRFRRIPGVDISTAKIIICNGGRFEITSVENVKSKGMYIEVLAKKVESSG